MENKIQTKDKIMIPIRVSEQLYKKIRMQVNTKKDENRGYSINKYVVDLIEQNLKQKF